MAPLMSTPPQLEVRHATRLEWIIIWLIVAEVCVCARARLKGARL